MGPVDKKHSYMSSDLLKVKSLSRVRLFAIPWTVGYQAPPSLGFSRQEYWSGLPFPSPGELHNPGIEPRPLVVEAQSSNHWKGRELLVCDSEVISCLFSRSEDFPGGSDGKASAYDAAGLGSIPGLGRSPGERNGNPLQYSCLENPRDGGAW